MDKKANGNENPADLDRIKAEIAEQEAKDAAIVKDLEKQLADVRKHQQVQIDKLKKGGSKA